MAANNDRISAADMAVLKRLGINYESLPKGLKTELTQELWGADPPPLRKEAIQTFPTDAEICLGLEQWYHANEEGSDEQLNGSKLLHLLEAYSVVAPLYLSTIPKIGDLVILVWKLIPSALRKVIKEKAKGATADDKAFIASTITTFVSTALQGLGIPAIVIRTILGPVVRTAVDWIVDNVNQLPN
ncbi:hypothetical protein F4680DRAFT_419202 [Xylaria scruposa]|nr:hypothetical protein F4680DRAFT_419202 [Xylaria scruposa]